MYKYSKILSIICMFLASTLILKADKNDKAAGRANNGHGLALIDHIDYTQGPGIYGLNHSEGVGEVGPRNRSHIYKAGVLRPSQNKLLRFASYLETHLKNLDVSLKGLRLEPLLLTDCVYAYVLPMVGVLILHKTPNLTEDLYHQKLKEELCELGFVNTNEFNLLQSATQEGMDQAVLSLWEQRECFNNTDSLKEITYSMLQQAISKEMDEQNCVANDYHAFLENQLNAVDSLLLHLRQGKELQAFSLACARALSPRSPHSQSGICVVM